MEMEEELNQPWSGQQIKQQLGPLMKYGKMLLYKQLDRYNQIEKLLPGPKSFAVIYVAVNRMNGVGHWVVVLRNGHHIMVFDPLGMRPDRHLSWTKPQLRESLGQDEPHLTVLLNQALKRGFKVTFDETGYQQKDSDVCGRYVVARVKHLFAHPKGDENSFYQFLKRHREPNEDFDEVIVQLVDD